MKIHIEYNGDSRTVSMESGEKVSLLTEKLIELDWVVPGENVVWVLQQGVDRELLSYFPYPNKEIQHVPDKAVSEYVKDGGSLKLVRYATPGERAAAIQPRLANPEVDYIKEYSLCELGTSRKDENADYRMPGSVMWLYMASFFLLLAFLIIVASYVMHSEDVEGSLVMSILIRALVLLVPGILCFILGKTLEKRHLKKVERLKKERAEKDPFASGPSAQELASLEEAAEKEQASLEAEKNQKGSGPDQ